MPSCTKCGREGPLGGSFCPKCGTPVTTPTAQPVELSKRRITFRPIVWGLILTVIGGSFWISFSVIGALGKGATEAIIGSLFRDPNGIYEAKFFLEHSEAIYGAVMGFIVQALIVGAVIQYLRHWWQKRKGAKDPKAEWGKSLMIASTSIVYLNIILALEKVAARTVVPVPGFISNIMIVWAMVMGIILALKE